MTPPSPHPSHNEEKLLENNYVNEQPGNIAKEIKQMTISSSCASISGISGALKRI